MSLQLFFSLSASFVCDIVRDVGGYAAGVVDGTLLALAGLRRLGLDDVIERSTVVPHTTMLPAVAQGAIGIQCRSDDSRALRYLTALNHEDTKACVDCERAFLKALDGNCRTPIAGQASIKDGRLNFTGFLSKADGTGSLLVEHSGLPEESEALGRATGQWVRDQLGSEKFEQYRLSFDEAI